MYFRPYSPEIFKQHYLRRTAPDALSFLVKILFPQNTFLNIQTVQSCHFNAGFRDDICAFWHMNDSKQSLSQDYCSSVTQQEESM